MDRPAHSHNQCTPVDGSILGRVSGAPDLEERGSNTGKCIMLQSFGCFIRVLNLYLGIERCGILLVFT